MTPATGTTVYLAAGVAFLIATSRAFDRAAERVRSMPMLAIVTVLLWPVLLTWWLYTIADLFVKVAHFKWTAWQARRTLEALAREVEGDAPDAADDLRRVRRRL